MKHNRNSTKLILHHIEMETNTNYDFYRNSNFIRLNYSYQEFGGFLRLEPYTVELEVILYRLQLKFIDSEDYMYCHMIQLWINRHTK
jgi:hypothetical protein